MKTTVWLAVSVILMGFQSDRSSTVEAIMEADREFSKLSARVGHLQAFYEFMDDSAKVLPQKGHPYDKGDYQGWIEKAGDTPSKARLTWEPIQGDASESGDLGYTLGRWTMTQPDSTGGTSTRMGYYITIWKKQRDGRWKFVLDGGNEYEPDGITSSE